MDDVPWKWDLIDQPLDIRDGYIHVPNRPAGAPTSWRRRSHATRWASTSARSFLSALEVLNGPPASVRPMSGASWRTRRDAPGVIGLLAVR